MNYQQTDFACKKWLRHNDIPAALVVTCLAIAALLLLEWWN